MQELVSHCLKVVILCRPHPENSLSHAELVQQLRTHLTELWMASVSTYSSYFVTKVRRKDYCPVAAYRLQHSIRGRKEVHSEAPLNLP